MTQQIIKGWVKVTNPYWSDESEVLIVDTDEYPSESDLNLFYSHDISMEDLITDALEKSGFESISTDDDFSDGVVSNYIQEGVSMSLYASEVRETLNEIKERIVLDAMGLLNYKVEWYGWSEYTIEGYNIASFKLGGHDIDEIIRSHNGKYIYLVIEKKD